MRWFAMFAPCLLICSACSDPNPNAAAGAGADAAYTADAATAGTDALGSDSAADAAGGADAPAGSDAAGADGTGVADAVVDGDAAASGVDAGVDSGIDYDLLDPVDSGPDGQDAPPLVDSGLSLVFAHSSSQLYRLEQNVFSLVGTFQFNKNFGQVTDIALDDNGFLYAVTFDDLFKCDKATAKCQWLAGLPQQFNGLTFVPKDVVTPGQAALIGIANSGDWNLITVQGNTATIKKLGAYGGFSSSGDAFSVEGIGTYATVKSGFGGTDKLVQVNPANGSVLKTVGDTGVSDLWGVAWSAQVLYGFSASGAVYSLDVQTGKASSVPGLSVPKVAWWGAGVSTRATGK